MAMFSHLKAVLSLDNKNFTKNLTKSQQQVASLSDSFNMLGRSVAGAFSIAAIVSFSSKLADLHVDTRNVTRAFERFGGNRDYMESLRESTGDMVDDLKLMQQSVQAVNLNLNAADLPTFFKFATIRAAETGVAVDYLVNSIVTGVGRQSRLVLDNLGISLKELNAEIAKTGDFGEAAFNLIERGIEESNLDINDLVKGTLQLQSAFKNFKIWLANSGLGEFFDLMAKNMAKAIRALYGDTGDVEYKITGRISESSLQYAEEDKLVTELKRNSMEYYELLEKIQVMRARGEDGIGRESIKYQGKLLLIKMKNISLLKEEIALRGAPELKKPRPTDIDTDAGKGKEYQFATTGSADFIKQYIAVLKDYQTQADLSVQETVKLENQIADLEIQVRKIIEPFKLAQDTFADTVIMLDETTEAVAKFGIELNDIASMAIQSFVGALQQAIDTGDVLGAFGSFLKDLGSLLMMYGSALIAMGVGQKLLETGDAVSKIIGGGIVLAAGAVLYAAGGAIQKGGATGSFSSVGSSGSYSGGTYGGGQGYDWNREIVMVARGEDLVGVINEQRYINGTN